MKLVTTEEIRLAEQAAVDAGDSWEALMDRAGQAVADEGLAQLKRAVGEVEGRRALALVGPGNNGGDALVAAVHLHDAGLRVVVYLWKRETDPADYLVAPLEQRGVRFLRAEEDEGWAVLGQEVARSDLIIDGLLGLGLQRPVSGDLAEIVHITNEAGVGLVLAIDLPTGVHADSGQILGVAIEADVTVTMGQAKRGLYQYPGAGYAGQVVVVDIGIPDKFLRGVQVCTLEAASMHVLLPSRPMDAHKGLFGRVLVVAGSLYYTGAPYLAAMGAYRAGAGLVTLASPRTIYPILASKAVETTFLPLPEGERGAIGEEAVRVLSEALDQYQVLVLGCGLGQEDSTVGFVRRLLGARDPMQPGIGFLSQLEEAREQLAWELPPLVLDADGLNALASIPEWWKALPPLRAVLTPHPGEMARLLIASREEVLASRIAVAQRAAGTWQQVVVLKGAYTVVAHPDGRAVVNPMANPVLAVAGTGDVLAGVIGGFIAQGLPLFEAALLGVYVHAAAGDLLRQEWGLAGGLAGELLDYLPQVLAQLREKV